MASEKQIVSGHANARVEALDLLRLIAALAVVMFHYGFHGPSPNGLLDSALPEIGPFAKYGFLGVPLFFVISGFVIAYSAEGRTASAFAIARVTRIYPAFLFCMTVTFVVILAFGAPDLQANVGQWTANFLIAAPALHQPYIDSVYWTIVSELTFYGWVYLLLAAGLFRRRIDFLVLIWLPISLLNETALDSFALRKLLLTNQSGYFAAGLLLYEMYLGRRDAAVQWLFAMATACAVSQALTNAKELQSRFMVGFDGSIVATICLAAVIVVMIAVRVRRVPLPPNVIPRASGPYPTQREPPRQRRQPSFHRSVELEFPPIGFDPARLSCRRDFPGPPELGAVHAALLLLMLEAANTDLVSPSA